MATASNGWKCEHSAWIESSTDTTATIRVECKWKNNGWTYDVGYVSAWVYCGGSPKQVKFGTDNDRINSTGDKYKSVSCGYADFTVNKSTTAQSISCYATIKVASSYVSGTQSSTAANVSVSAKTSYTIKYDANGGTGAPGNQTKWHGTNLQLSTVTPTRTGYTFDGWHYNKATADSGTSYYSSGDWCGKDENLTLYAVWRPNTYTITYDANGGTLGDIRSQTKTYGINLTLTGTATRTNYKFVGWGLSKTLPTIIYLTGSTFRTEAPTTLYAIWELDYVKPKITNADVSRYALVEGEYVLNDNGTYALVSFDYECNRTIKEIKIEWENSSKTHSDSTTISATENSGAVDDLYIGGEPLSEDELDPNSVYTIKITVEDEVNHSTEFLTLNGINIPIDVLMDDEEGPKGISFGKPAELEGKADFGYEIYPRNGIANILLKPETDLNTVLTPNTYIGENVSTYSYQNCPITSGTFSLEVVSGGPDGQVIQTLTATSQTNCIIYQRHYHRVDGEWMWTKDSSGNYIWNCIYSAQGKLLWSGAWHMNATQSSVLSEPISYQPSGIVLVFSMYNLGAAKKEDYAWNEFFVPKQVVQRHGGKGHSFLMSDATAVIAAKYLYIYDDHIDGYTSTENVNVGNDCVVTANGITYKNSSFVLRYVFGV